MPLAPAVGAATMRPMAALASAAARAYITAEPATGPNKAGRLFPSACIVSMYSFSFLAEPPVSPLLDVTPVIPKATASSMTCSMVSIFARMAA